MTPEQKQRLDLIREKVAASPHNYHPDFHFLLSLVESQEAGCSLCGGPHDFDTSVPSATWNAVIRARGLPEYLCATCIVREFVRAGTGFTATLWNEEFYGIPIEVVVNGQNARDAAAIQEENNSLRAELHNSAEAIVNEADKVAHLMNSAADSMRSRCVEKVKTLRDEWQQKHDTLNADTDLIDRLSLEGDIRVADKIMKELESVSIQEQEKQ